MNALNLKWTALSTLTTALCLASLGLRAETPPAPNYDAESCCNLCPAAHDARRYDSRYLRNFLTLVDAKQDWLFRTQDDLRTEFGTTRAGYQYMKELRDAFKRKGVELVLVYQPTRGLTNRSKLNPEDYARFDYDKALKNYRATLEQFRKIGFVVPDLSVLADENEPDNQSFYFKGDQHWTPFGAERSARIVADEIHKLAAFEGIARKEFVTKRIGQLGKRGTMHTVAGQLCQTSYAVQYVDRFQTEPKDESGGGDLFGDQAIPEITLIGTSHSGPNYNFGGYLEQYIGADVLNMAFAGGGYEGAMLQYIGSDSFQKTPPKILIWEFAPHYDLAQDSVYRQMMALLDNGCEGQPAVLAGKATLNAGSTEVLVNGEKSLIPVRSGSHQMDIRFSDESVRKLEATIWYLNGRREQLKIEQPASADTDGRFTFRMRDEGDWADLAFLALEIQKPEQISGPLKVEATVCKRPGAKAGNLAAKAGS